MAIATTLTRLLGIPQPIIGAPMGAVSGGRLAAAVTNAGGLGLLGPGYLGPEWIEKEKQILAERLGTPEEVAAAALLLASDDGNFFMGQFVSPNGGAVFT